MNTEKHVEEEKRRPTYHYCLFGCAISSVISVLVICLIYLFGYSGGNNCSSDTFWAQINISEASSVIEMPLRYQWIANDGYCGECCLISTGLALGQYFSQYDVREIAANSHSDPNNPQILGEVLLGENANYTASKLRLNYSNWEKDTIDAKSFLVWVKDQVYHKRYVTIGVYTNEFLFYCDRSKSAGDSEYDHIVHVVAIDSVHPNDGAYYDDDVLYFSDNGLWGESRSSSRYIFNYTFRDIQASRSEANSRDWAVYSLPSTVRNYGLVVSGVMDSGGDTMPISVQTSVNYEEPSIKEGSNTRPPSTPLTLTVIVSSLVQGQTYILYKYTDEEKVPTKEFNANAALADRQWTIPVPLDDCCGQYSLTDNITSDQKAIFRAVLASAP